MNKARFDILMRRYQKYMVALLGIEQLTGTVRVPTVTINTQGRAEAARTVSALRREKEAIDEQIKALEKEKATAETTDARKADIDKEIAELAADRTLVEKGIAEARGLSASGAASANVSVVNLQGARGDEHVRAVAQSVEKLVLQIINSDDTGQLCFSHLGSAPKAEHPLAKFCATFLENINRTVDVRIKAAGGAAEQVIQSKLSPEKKATELQKISEGIKDSFLTGLPGQPATLTNRMIEL